MIIDIFRLKRNKQIAEDEKLRLKITLAWWNPSEVNPAPSLGKWTKKTHFGTDFIHNTFENYPQCPIDKRKSFQTSKQEILSPLVWKYLNITGRGFGQYDAPPVLVRKHLQNEPICYNGESLVWSIWANFPLWKKNYVVQAEIRVQSDQVRWGDMDWG